MDGLAATLELLRPEEIPDALYFVDLMELVGHMDAREADEWRRRIQAWCRLGPRAVPAKAGWRVPMTLVEEPDPFVL